MEQLQHVIETLELMDRPAFCVRDGAVVYANRMASGRMIVPEMPVSQLIFSGLEEYETFAGGCLCLTLSLGECPIGATVTKLGQLDLFRLDHDTDQAELRAMALAARELREPLANIMAAADRLFPTLGDGSASDHAAQINRSAHQLLRLIGNMADAARYTGEASYRQENRNICAIVDEIFEKAAVLAEQAGLKLRYQGLSESIYCLVDCEKLERAIYNILSNAIKFTPAGGTVEARLKRSGNRLALTVQDSGEGIREALRPGVWFRYQREPALEDRRQGIGLGMVLIRAAAAAHAGTVLLQEAPGGGLKLTVTFAIRQSSNTVFHSPILRVDYAGERDHGLIELADSLPVTLYESK